MTKTEELEKAVQMLEEQVETNKSLGMNYLEDLTKAKKDLENKLDTIKRIANYG